MLCDINGLVDVGMIFDSLTVPAQALGFTAYRESVSTQTFAHWPGD